jgi:class 3 adenylate cyclase
MSRGEAGQILISSRVARAVAILEGLGNLKLRGLRRLVAAFNIAQSTSPGEVRPNLDDPQQFRYTPIAQPNA